MSKNGNGMVNDFVKEAIREKAARELASLNQRADAVGGVERSRDALFTISNDLTGAAAAVTAVAGDATVAAKMKKLRKLVEDAHVLDQGGAGVGGQRQHQGGSGGQGFQGGGLHAFLAWLGCEASIRNTRCRP